MLVSEALNLLRHRVNDAEFETGWDDEALIMYLNDAMKYLSNAIIVRNDPVLTKTFVVDVTLTNTVPKNFVRFAGGYPVRRMGDAFLIIDDSTTVNTKYFYIPDEVSALTDTLPFATNDVYCMLMVNIAALYALNQHEFNLSTDFSIKEEAEKLIVAALGGD